VNGLHLLPAISSTFLTKVAVHLNRKSERNFSFSDGGEVYKNVLEQPALVITVADVAAMSRAYSAENGARRVRFPASSWRGLFSPLDFRHTLSNHDAPEH
jgi:hypothetical protein